MAIEVILKEYFIRETRIRRAYDSPTDCFLADKLEENEYGPYGNYAEAESAIASLQKERKAKGWLTQEDGNLYLRQGYDLQEIGYFLDHRTKTLFSSESSKK